MLIYKTINLTYKIQSHHLKQLKKSINLHNSIGNAKIYIRPKNGDFMYEQCVLCLCKDVRIPLTMHIAIRSGARGLKFSSPIVLANVEA